MNVGRQLKQAFDKLLRLMGHDVQIHKGWGTPLQQTFEARGLKNNEKGRPANVIFQFPEAMEIHPGDVLQQVGARDLWKAIDVEDIINGGHYICFEVKVQKLSGTTTRPSPDRAQVIVQGSVYGGIQLDSPHATQNISIHALQIDENLRQLRELLQQVKISELEKEETQIAIDRVAQLSRKERSPEVLNKIKEKVDLIKNTFDITKDIASLAAPYISSITQILS